MIKIEKIEYESVVISLPFRIDRRNFISNQFKSIGFSFTFFDAFNGLEQEDIIKFSRNSKKYLSHGSKGCIISHISVWKKLLSSNHDNFIIFEDDVILLSDYKYFINSIKSLPNDFDIVYLGSGSDRLNLNKCFVSEKFYIPFSVRKGMYAYILSKKGATKLISNLNEINITCGGIDTIVGVLTMRNKIKTYHFNPSLMGVNFNLGSDIRFSKKNKHGNKRNNQIDI